MRNPLFVCSVLGLGAGALYAQDPIPPVDQGVRIGITYTPGVRPGMLVLRSDAGAMIDSVEAILQRDLDFSDRFEVITLPGGERVIATVRQSPDGTAPAGRFVNYPLYSALGAEFAVDVVPLDSVRVAVTLYDVRGQIERKRIPVAVGQVFNSAFRMAVHRAADELVLAAAGEYGYAASSVLFVQNGRLLLIDADGGDVRSASSPGEMAFSPAWEQSGRRYVYTVMDEGWGRLIVVDRATQSRRVVRASQDYMNFTAAFSPNGEIMAFARSDDSGTQVMSYNLQRDCCLTRLTTGRFSDNLSPTFSPDGRRIAYVSTRAGLPQIYVMAADGTGQELFAPFDYGVTGSSYAPEWSPDGTRLVFHRDVAGSPQVFVMDTRSRVVRQLTSAGRNEDPTWAPDSRHITFVSDRTGSRQLWVIDIETGRVRQLTRIGDVRIPAWSPRLPDLTLP